MTTTPDESLRASVLRVMQEQVADVNRANGWYEDDRTFGDDLALLHSEVSEALEAFRDHGYEDVTETLCNKPEHHPGAIVHGNHLCKPEGVGSELADVLVRLLDTAERRGVDLAYEFDRKVEFNATRARRHGGKRL